MTDLLILLPMLAIGPAYLLGRYVELKRWELQRDHFYDVLNAAQERVGELRQAEEMSLRIVRQQRELLDTFAAATERINQGNGDGWARLSWACHRARTELL